MSDMTWTAENTEFDHVKQKLLEYYVTMNYANSQYSINAFERVPRSLFVPNGQRPHCFGNALKKVFKIRLFI